MSEITAILYSRWSTSDQSQNDAQAVQFQRDSLRRQADAAHAWSARTGIPVDVTSYRDEGVSAFKRGGRNRRKGKLSEFVKDLENGTLNPKTTWLLVEDHDRISRASVSVSFEAIVQMLGMGLTIHFLNPGTTYTSKDLSSPQVLMLFFGLFLANAESQRKSVLISEAYKKTLDASVKAGKPISTNRKIVPFWIDAAELRDKEAKTEGRFVLNAKAEAVRLIFKAAAEGETYVQIAKTMNATHAELNPTGKGWGESTIRRLLRNEAVIGRYHVHTTQGGTARKATGQVVEGYYPPAIDAKLWGRVQTALATSTIAKTTRGIKGDSGFVNLFTGIVFDAETLARLSIHRSPDGRRLHDGKALSGVPGRQGKTVRLAEFETAILRGLNEAKAELFRNEEGNRKEYESKCQRLEWLAAQMQAIKTSTISGGFNQLSADLHRTHSQESKTLQREVTAYESRNARQDAASFDTLQGYLSSKTGDALKTARTKLKHLLAKHCERILIKLEVYFNRTYWLAEIIFRNGNRKLVFYTPNLPGLVVDAELKAKIDRIYNRTSGEMLTLTDPEAAKKPLLQGFAQSPREAKTVPYDVPAEIPTELHKAIEVYVSFKRTTLHHFVCNNLRSRLKVLQRYCGDDARITDLNPISWRAFVSNLKLQASAGVVVQSTASEAVRVAKNFLLWLGEVGALKVWDELRETPASKLIPPVPWKPKS